MAPGVAASADAAAGAAQHKGDRGYGARQYTYQHRPHDPPVERPPPSTSAADLQASSSSVLRLHSEEEGVKAAAAVLRNQQAFVDLGWRAPKRGGEASAGGDDGAPEGSAANGDGPSPDPQRTAASAQSPSTATLEPVPADPPSTAQRRTQRAPTLCAVATTNPHILGPAEPCPLAPEAEGPESTTSSPAPSAAVAAAVKRPHPLCAKVLCAGQKQLQCYVDQRLVLAPEPGDIVVIRTPGGTTDTAAATKGTSGAAPEILGRVVALSRWSRSKAGPGHRYPAAVRRATVVDVDVGVDAVECAGSTDIAKLRKAFGGALVRLFRTRLHADGPSVLTLAEVHHDVLAAAGHTAASVRAAVAGATGAHARHVFVVVISRAPKAVPQEPITPGTDQRA